jgi:hypothetical protein
MGQLEQQQRFVDQMNEAEPIPDDVSIPELAEQVARGKRKVTAQQMRMLVELLPYYSPKLTAVAVGHLTGEDFYNRLERAVNRTNAKLIEGSAVQVDEHVKLRGAGRRWRRWIANRDCAQHVSGSTLPSAMTPALSFVMT